MSEVIKQWVYDDYDNKPKYVEYRADGGVWIQNFYDNDFRRHEPLGMISYSYCTTHYTIDAQISQYLAQNLSFESKQLLAGDEQHLRFWKHIDLSKIPTSTFTPPIKYGLQSYLEISPEGVWTSYMNNSSIKQYNTSFRLNNLFFNGPPLAGLPLEDRKKLRQVLFDAIDSKAGFQLSDAFPLFDYDKISFKKWDYTSDNGNSGNFVELYPDRFSIGGWSHRDGGAQDSSIEEIWSKRPLFVDKMFGSANDELEIILSNALIKE